MADIKQELVEMLNRALELEHMAAIQYLAHAELVKGMNAEKIIERLKEIASDEIKHQDMFRNLIGSCLNGEPSISMAKAHRANEINEILEVNLTAEKEAIDFYKQIYNKAVDNKDQLRYEFETIEHEIRHIVVDEQEHMRELSLLLGI